MLIDKPLRELLAAFGSSSPTPGGGSASAVAGALGASLLVMVSALPKTRHNTEDDRRALTDAGDHIRPLHDRLMTLVDQDTDAYNQVVSAHRLPRGTDAERQARTDAIQRALTDATETPLAVMRATADALELAMTIAQHGNPSAASDVAVATGLLGAALRGAQLNVETNLDGLQDPTYVGRVRRDVATFAAAADHRGKRVRDLLRR